MIGCLRRLAAQVCDGSCESGIRLALRATRAEARVADARQLEERAFAAAEREWANRYRSMLACKRDLERQLNAERELVEQMKAERRP